MSQLCDPVVHLHASAFHPLEYRQHIVAAAKDDQQQPPHNKLLNGVGASAAADDARAAAEAAAAPAADEQPDSSMSFPSCPSTPSSPRSTSSASASVFGSGVTRQSLLSPKAKQISQLLDPSSPLIPAVSRLSGQQPGSAADAQPSSAASLLPPSTLSSILHSSTSGSPSPEPILPILSDINTASSPSPSPIPTSASSSSSSPPPASSSSSAAAQAYPDDSLETRQLKFIYRVYHHVCDIYFAVDKDLNDLPSTRNRLQSATPTTLPSSSSNTQRSSIPDTVSPGYGELARSGFDKVVHYMCEEAPTWLRMDKDCAFLDIGSGFGKCVLHAKVRGKVRESKGIEYIPVRHEKAAETLHYLRARFVPGMTDGNSTSDSDDGSAESQLLRLMQSIELDGVSLVQGDICDERHHPLLYRASHIYMFDVVFSDATMSQILPLIQQSNFALFACYHRPSYLQKLGCHQFSLLHQMAMKTTGKQSFTCYFYVKSGAGSKVTRTIQKQWEREKEERQSKERKSREGQAAQSRDGERDGSSSQASRTRRKTKGKRRIWSVKKGTRSKKKQRIAANSRDDDDDDEDDDEEEEEEEDVEEDQLSNDAAEEEEAEAPVTGAKLQHKRKSVSTAATAATVKRTKDSQPQPAAAPAPPRGPRSITYTSAASLAADAFIAMVTKAVAARLVMDHAKETKAARAQEKQRLAAAAAAAAAAQPAAADSPAELPLAATDPTAPPLFERAPTLVHMHDEPELDAASAQSQLLPPPAAAAAPSAGSLSPSPAVHPQSSGWTHRVAVKQQTEEAKRSAARLLSRVQPHAVFITTQLMEQGLKTTPHLLLAAMEHSQRYAAPQQQTEDATTAAATAKQETEAMADLTGAVPVLEQETASESLEGEPQQQELEAAVQASPTAETKLRPETASPTPPLWQQDAGKSASESQQQQQSELHDAHLADTKGSMVAMTTAPEPLPDAKAAMEVDSVC